MSWQTSTFAIACFSTETPAIPDGYGDSAEFCTSLDEAQQWAKKAIQGGRFKYLVIWRQNGGYWIVEDEYRESDLVKPKLNFVGSQKTTKALTNLDVRRATANVGRAYSKQDILDLRAYAKARVPLQKIAKATKRTEGGVLQKAKKLKIKLTI